MAIYGKDIIFNEAYFGKSKELLDIEKQIGVVRKKFSRANIYIGDINGDPEILKLNRLFEKALNINCFCIIVNRQSLENAYTIPVGYHYDTGTLFNPSAIKKLTIVDKKGMKFVKDNKLSIICHIYAGLLLNPKYTDGEVLAIILHELGHNFAEALDPKIAMNTMILSHMQIILDLLNWLNGRISLNSFSPEMYNSLIKDMSKLREYMYKNCKPIISLFNLGTGVLGALQDAMINIKFLMQSFVPIDVVRIIVRKSMQMIIKPTGYRNEKIADRFATMHGYSVELTSALSKLETGSMGIAVKEALDQVPIVGTIIGFVPATIALITAPFDEHPIWSERIEDQIRALEFELKKNDIDPKMRKEIEWQVKQIKDLKSNIIKSAGDITKSAYLKRIWFAAFADGDMKHHLVGDLDQQLDLAAQRLRIKEGSSILGFERKFDLFNEDYRRY